MAFSSKTDCFSEKPSEYLARFELLTEDISWNQVKQWVVLRSLPEDIRLALVADQSLKTAHGLVQSADRLVQSKKETEKTDSTETMAVAFDSKKKKRKRQLCQLHAKFGDKAKECKGNFWNPCPMF